MASSTEARGESEREGGGGEVKEEARPSSPEASCPICLDTVTNAAYTDMCCHRFCFHCLVCWSRIKPECPLCKQRFSLIIHNVRSMADYDQLPVAWPDPPPPTLDANFFISVAIQRPRFRYRTTAGGWGWSFQEVLAGPSATSGRAPLMPSTSSSTAPAPVERPIACATPIGGSEFMTFSPGDNTFVGNTVATEWRRRRQVSAVEFRRNVYRQNQWVCPPVPRTGAPLRIRESSPSFYRNNPAQGHRLIPWLHRELLVLLDVQFDYQEVCQMILHAISNIPIRSPRFQAMMWPYLHERTSHFCHEFYNFATSPYDMLAYDLRAEYVRRDLGYNEPPPSDHDNSGSDSSNDIEVIEPERREGELIEISDEEVIPVDDNGADTDTSVEIISTLPPLADREPEIIDLVDSGSDVEAQNFVNNFADYPGDRSPNPSRWDRTEGQLRKKFRPWYKDESSSSEEEMPRRRPMPRRRQLRKRKRKCKQIKKRKKIVADYSSSEDEKKSPKSSSESSSGENSPNRARNQSNSDVSVTSPPSRKARSRSRSSHTSKDKSSDSNPGPSRSRKRLTISSEDEKPLSLSQPSFSPVLPQEDEKPLLLTQPSYSPASPQPEPSYLPPIYSPKHKYASPDSDWLSLDGSGREARRESTPPRPRLKSVVKKVKRSEEPGCSKWRHSHNLRQRKLRYTFLYTSPSYIATSDSDS